MSKRNNKLDNQIKEANNMLNSNVTITECVQISRGVAEDVITDYHKSQGNVQLAMSIQIELIKESLIKAGIITEESFRERYIEEAKKLQEMQMKAKEETGVTDMKVSAGDVEVTKMS